MIMTNYLIKYLSKQSDGYGNVIVIGSGFGLLEEIISTFNTVFLFSEESTLYREKNVVYRQSFGDISELPRVSTIFLGSSNLESLRLTKPVWLRDRSMVIIQGIPLENSPKVDELIKNNYRISDQTEIFHIWKLKA